MTAEEAHTQPETIGLIEAAALLHIGREALRTLCERGEIPALSLNRKHWVLLRSDVLAYIAHTARRQAAARRRSCEPSAPQIDTAWRRLAARHHPDRGGDSAQMARINTARDQGLARAS